MREDLIIGDLMNRIYESCLRVVSLYAVVQRRFYLTETLSRGKYWHFLLFISALSSS
jgi:hypothetical protein